MLPNNTVHVVQGWLESTIYYMSTLLLSQYHQTPAHYAAYTGEVEALKLLQEQGALFNLVNNVSAAYTVYYTVHITP